MSLKLQYLIDYPFLSDSAKNLEILDYDANKNGDLDSYFVARVQSLFERFPKVQDGLINLFNDIFAKIEKISKPIKAEIGKGDFSNIALYKLSIIVSRCFNNPAILNGLANLWAKDSFDNYKRIDRNHEHFRLEISRDLGITAEKADMTNASRHSSLYMEYSMKYTDYLSQSIKYNNAAYKLSNKIVSKGKVFLIKEDLAHLVREAIRQRIVQAGKDIEIYDALLEKLKAMPQFFKVYSHIENSLLQKNNPNYDKIAINEGKITSDFFPPCINVLLDKSLHGINLNHNERLAITFFYLNTHHSIEETVDIFRTMPDFDEKLTRYHVIYASGERNSSKRYSMFGCEKMKSLLICQSQNKTVNERICRDGVIRKGNPNLEFIKNPMEFIFWKKLEIIRK